jgi:hypothetical protein
MSNQEKIKNDLLKRGCTSDTEALLKYGILPGQLNKICLDIRKEGYFIKKYRNFITFTYLLINLDKY